ncbi:MAG TPA: hypothetical protein VEY12_00675 [Thermoplasmata archaeon]|nr:hypothetical protein [Thermoplasmata archaeon]
MATVDEIVATTHTHEYKVTFKSAVWGTLLATVLMAALYAVFGLPPGFDSYYAIMFFHSIGIGIAAMAVFMVIVAFDLRKYEPGLDMPLYYRALSAVLFGSIGGLLFLIPETQALRGLPMGFTFLGLLMIADAGGALFIELLLMPRKKAGVYAMNYELRPVPTQMGYLSRMLPLRKEDRAAYRRMPMSYWLVLFSVASAFIAGILGFVNLWVMTFGPGIFSGYLSFMGPNYDILGNTLDPHSHEMALAIMAGVIAIAAERFGVLRTSDVREKVAKLGLSISLAGVVGMTVVFLAIAFGNFSPPTLFADPTGTNGMAGDDAVMTIIAVGAMIALVPLALTKREADGQPSWRDPVRLSLLGTWVAAVVISVVAAFYIEFHEDVFQTTLLANDAVFGELQSLFGVFLLTAVSLILLAVDLYKVEGSSRRLVGWAAGLGISIGTAGAIAWAFIDPSTGGIPFAIHLVGIGLTGVAAVVSAVAIHAVPVPKGTILRIYAPADLDVKTG